jgi:hypothetical protein
VDRKRKAAEEEIKEHYLVTAWRLRDSFRAREDDGVLGRHEAVCFRILHLLPLDNRSRETGGSGSLHHGVLNG